jgi:hypothetical protein
MDKELDCFFSVRFCGLGRLWQFNLANVFCCSVDVWKSQLKPGAEETCVRNVSFSDNILWAAACLSLPSAAGQSSVQCTLHCTALHCTALHCTVLHCTTFHISSVVKLSSQRTYRRNRRCGVGDRGGREGRGRGARQGAHSSVVLILYVSLFFATCGYEVKGTLGPLTPEKFFKVSEAAT